VAPSNRRARTAQAKQAKNASRGWGAPGGLVALALVAVVAYLVVKRADDVKEVKVAGYGIVFRDQSSSGSRPPEEKRVLARQVQQAVEQELQQEAPTPVRTDVDLTGTWTMPGTDAIWTVSRENGFVVFRETATSAPDVVGAMGYGAFDGQTWTVQFHTIEETEGAAVLALVDDRTLRGEATVGDERFAIELQR
jgi:hypothetical protein